VALAEYGFHGTILLSYSAWDQINMTQHPTNDRLAMSANVQGFELPMGCLMTSVFILLPVITIVVGLTRASSVSDVVFAVLIPVAVITCFALSQRYAHVGRG